jgi:exodeoxyribonuclease V
METTATRKKPRTKAHKHPISRWVGNIQLTLSQWDAVQSLLVGILDKRRKAQTLVGSAGTGKTTSLKALIMALLKYGLDIAVTAPTNKAVLVLEETISPQRGVTFCTCHSLLGLRVRWREGKKVLDPEGSKAKDYDLIVVDECSMVNAELYGLLLKEGKPLIFVGDHCQLPPINESADSQSFRHTNTDLKLNQVVRQAIGNPIIQLAQALRNAQERATGIPDLRAFASYCGRVTVLQNEAEFMAKFMAAVKQKGDEIRAIAWTNARTFVINAAVRSHLYGEMASADFLKGERVMIAETVEEDGNIVLQTGHETTITEAVAVTVSVDTEIDEKDRPFLQVQRVDTGDGRWQLLCWVFVLGSHPKRRFLTADSQSREALKQIRAELAREKAWRPLAQTYAWFSDIRPIHAITTHRAQGSTWNTVFVDSRDILKNRNQLEALRCLYVAVTRPSERLVVLV